MIKKIKLRDLTIEQYKDWYKQRNCPNTQNCSICAVHNVICNPTSSMCWVYYKDLYSDNFLNQEIEIDIKPQLSELEKGILQNFNNIEWYKYLVRDKNNCLLAFVTKPKKTDGIWWTDDGEYTPIPFYHLFQFIKSDDEEPYLIKDLLKEDNK